MPLLHLTGTIFIFLFLGCTSALTGPGTVRGFVGRPLSVTCHYDANYQTYNKYWCKGVNWRSCTEVVKTTGSEEEVEGGRTLIKDNYTCSCFTVTLENLMETDAGVYWCAIEQSLRDTHVKVIVVAGCFPESLTCSSTVREPLGGVLSILCKYTGYQTYTKYCCRGEAWDASCKKIITTKPSLVEKQGRISFNDNHSSQTFSIIIENLTLEDAGKYWCGIDISWSSDLYSPVTVEVFREPLPPTTTIVVTTGYFSTVHHPTTSLNKNMKSSPLNIRLLLPIVFLMLVMVLLVGGLLMMWRLKWKKAAKARGHTLLSMAPRHAACHVSNATVTASVAPNLKTPPPSSDQDLNSTLCVEYTSVKKTPARPTQPQVPSTNTEDLSYATIKFPAQDEQVIYANLN